MKCQKCGKNMPDGARYCISCGAEHDANGQLCGDKKVDYNKTIMIDDILTNNNSSKIDYNKTMMANDSLNSNGKIDYNKTMMANDLKNNNSKVDYNKTMMANDIPKSDISNIKSDSAKSKNNIDNKKKKKFSPITFIVLAFLIFAVVYKFLIIDNKKNVNIVNENIVQDVNIVENLEHGNVVSDFNATNGYWSNDAEFFYRNGTIQKNQWIGDYYVDSEGRKVRNKLIDDTYYVDATGKKVKNQWYKFTRNISGTNVTIWYYLGADGAKLRDTLTPDGYYVDNNGMYIPTEKDLPNSKVYIPNKQ